MHNTLKSKLPKARGFGDLVIVIFLDVRGFSNFAGTTESANAALFLRSIYSQIMNDYFPDVTFFKPTGDGLMIIRRYDDDDLDVIVNDSLKQSIALVEAFSTICASDKMINFKVPKYLGIGISRGAATRLASDEITLDYSGRPLNLAARLMDLARPSGVVFDGESLGIDLIEDDLIARFTEDHVFVRGIAESEPLSIHYLTDRTKIEGMSRLPINKYITKMTERENLVLKDFKSRGNLFHELPEEPALLDRCQIVINYPNVEDGKRTRYVIIKRAPARFARESGRPGVFYNYGEVYKEALAHGVKSTWPVSVYIEYEMNDNEPEDEGEEPMY